MGPPSFLDTPELPMWDGFEVDEVFNYYDGVLDGVGTYASHRYYFCINIWSKINDPNRLYDIYPIPEQDYQAMLNYDHEAPERRMQLDQHMLDLMEYTMPCAQAVNL